MKQLQRTPGVQAAWLPLSSPAPVAPPPSNVPGGSEGEQESSHGLALTPRQKSLRVFSREPCGRDRWGAGILWRAQTSRRSEGPPAQPWGFNQRKLFIHGPRGGMWGLLRFRVPWANQREVVSSPPPPARLTSTTCKSPIPALLWSKNIPGAGEKGHLFRARECKRVPWDSPAKALRTPTGPRRMVPQGRGLLSPLLPVLKGCFSPSHSGGPSSLGLHWPERDADWPPFDPVPPFSGPVTLFTKHLTWMAQPSPILEAKWLQPC